MALNSYLCKMCQQMKYMQQFEYLIEYNEDTMKRGELFLLCVFRYLTQLYVQASLCVLLKERLEVFLAARSLAASVEHLAISRLC